MTEETFTALTIAGAYSIELQRFADERGAFLESWRDESYAETLNNPPFVQQNLSYSTCRVLRGLHYQVGMAQAQLVTIVKGRVVDVIVDLRKTSKTFGSVEMLELCDGQPKQIYMPPGVAHGFQVVSEDAILHYMCSRYYDSSAERGLNWRDPSLKIKWPLREPIISDRDNFFPFLADISRDDLPE